MAGKLLLMSCQPAMSMYQVIYIDWLLVVLHFEKKTPKTTPPQKKNTPKKQTKPAHTEKKGKPQNTRLFPPTPSLIDPAMLVKLQTIYLPIVCRIAEKNCRFVWDLYDRCWESRVGKSPLAGVGLLGQWYDACTGEYLLI